MRNLIADGCIIGASEELVPVLRIAPFSSACLGGAPADADQEVASAYLQQRCGNHCLLPKGRSAIALALSLLGLQKDDVVTILTTSGNFYISGCVTREIEKVCKWSREFTERTRAIFVNHEFGYPYKGLSSLRQYGLPIIEDCAHSFFSDDGEMGRVGDYVVYSLPKAFPVQLGGVLSVRAELGAAPEGGADDVRQYLLSHLAQVISLIPEYKEKRLRNYHRLCDKLAPLGISPFFPLEEGVVPGVFLFRWSDEIDYPALKVFMQENGVECSVFYGCHAFFIPVHQSLTEAELDYMCHLLTWFYHHEQTSLNTSD